MPNNDQVDWDDSVRYKLRDIILDHLKPLDKTINCNAPGKWKHALETEIVEAWIVRIMEDKLGDEITGEVDADNRAIIVENVFNEMSKSLKYFVPSIPLDEPFCWDEEHMIPSGL